MTRGHRATIAVRAAQRSGASRAVGAWVMLLTLVGTAAAQAPDARSPAYWLGRAAAIAEADPSADRYARLAMAQAIARDAAACRRAIARADALAPPEPVARAGLDARIAAAYGQLGDSASYGQRIAAADARLRAIPGARAAMASVIARCQARAGDWAGCQATAIDVTEPAERLRLFCDAAAELAAQHKPDEAAAAVAEATAAAGREPDAARQKAARARVLSARLASGDLDGAEADAQQPRYRGWCAASLAAVGLARARDGDRRGYTRCIHRALELADGDGPLRAESYARVAAHQFRAGDAAGGAATARAARDAAAQTDDAASRASAWLYVAAAEAMAGDGAAAHQSAAGAERAMAASARPIPRGPGSPVSQLYVLLATGLAEGGDDAAAVAMAETFEPTAARPAALAAICRAESDAGRYDAAIALTARLAAGDRRAAYQAVARGQAATGHGDSIEAWVATLRLPADQFAAALGAAEGMLGRNVEGP